MKAFLGATGGNYGEAKKVAESVGLLSTSFRLFDREVTWNGVMQMVELTFLALTYLLARYTISNLL